MGSGNNAGVSVTDCTFTGNAGGEDLLRGGERGDRRCSLERCRIENSGGWGVMCAAGNIAGAELSMHATTVVHNNGGALSSAGFVSNTSIEATQCTIADNGNLGVSAMRFARAVWPSRASTRPSFTDTWTT